jgi:hypothetical protein
MKDFLPRQNPGIIGCCFLLALLLLAGISRAQADNSDRIQELLAQANRAVVSGVPDFPNLAIEDPKWVARLRAAFRETALGDGDHDFSEGWMTVTFFKDQDWLIMIAAIHGNLLRMQSHRGGADFPVDPARWKIIHDILWEKILLAQNHQLVGQQAKDFASKELAPQPPPLDLSHPLPIQRL